MKSSKTRHVTFAAALMGAAFALASPAFAQVDAAAAQAILKKNECGKCHAADKEKKGPSFKKIAAKYKGKPAEGEEKAIKNFTVVSKVKLDDGTEEDHKILKGVDMPAMKNLANYILSH